MKKIIGILIMAGVLTSSSVIAEEGITATEKRLNNGEMHQPPAAGHNLCRNVTEVKASSIFQNDIPGHSPKLLFDGRHYTGWGPLITERSGWVEFDLDKAVEVRRVVLDEGTENRIRGYAFKAKRPDGTWTELARGERIGYMYEIEFPAITAKTFRFEVTNSLEVPCMWEIELYSTPKAKFDNPREMAPKDSLEKFRSLKLGAWIILGPYTVAEQEASLSRYFTVPNAVYDQLYTKFNPVNFDPEGYMRILKKAGFKYVMFVPKHCDGFCLWDTKTTDYNVMNTPFQRDMLKELVAAAKKVGMDFNLYYSIADWNTPDYIPHGYIPLGSHYGGPRESLPEGETPDFDRYMTTMKTQLKELSDSAGPTLMWWFDANWSPNYTPVRAREIYAHLRELQPKGLFSNRIGSAFHRYTYAVTWFASEKESFGDYAVNEVVMPRFNRKIPWEFTKPANNSYSWTNTPIKPGITYVDWAVNSACGDGNQLIATAIKADGTFDEKLIEQFNVLEDWTTRFGESYYNTRGGPYMRTTWYGSTCNEDNVYIHVFKTDNGKLVLPPLGRRILSARLLGSTRGYSPDTALALEETKSDNVANVEVEQTDKNVIITLDPKDVNPLYTIVALKIKGEAFEIEPIEVVINAGVAVTASSVDDSVNKPENTCDGDITTFWKVKAGERSAWVEYDLGEQRTISRAILDEGMEESQPISISSYQVQAKIDGQWKTVFQSAPIWANHPWSIAVTNQEAIFTPVKARYYRLNISAAKDDLVVHEVRLYER